jgi:hypothetical protein
MFVMRNDRSFWYLDDVSVTNSSGSELLMNGNFEQGNLFGWTYCNPNQATYSSTTTSSFSYNGSYSHHNGSINVNDY